MNLDQQVTSLELSKRLCELGVKQESYFAWLKVPYNLWQISRQTENKIGLSAFTASELLGFYPKFIKDWYFRIEKYPSEFEVKYCDKEDLKRLCIEWDKNICNALAKMLIHLIENKLIEIK